MNSAKPIALLLIYLLFLITSISANNNTADDRIYKQAQELLAVMTLDEKDSLLSGRGSYDTQNIDRLNFLVQNIKSSQNRACLVWKILVDLGRVFCTYLEPPNSHIMQNPKIDRKLPKSINLRISPSI